jgi:antitoxin HicB
LIHALDAIETSFQGRMSDRAKIPPPRAKGPFMVEIPALTVTKVALYQAMLAQGLRKADLARMLGWKGPQVDRLFNLGHGSRLDQLEEAFRVMGKRLEIDVKNAA